jgi:hypothetical protein
MTKEGAFLFDKQIGFNQYSGNSPNVPLPVCLHPIRIRIVRIKDILYLERIQTMLKMKILAGLALMTVVLIAVTSTAMAAPNTHVSYQDVTTTPTPDLTVTPEPSVTPTATPTETAQNPVAAIIADFFGLDYSVVNEMHQEGTGYGVIAQSCWMSYQLEGDASACADIAEAKKTGDFSAFVMPDGSTPSNWGQFKKALSNHKSPGQTLGAIVSGHAKPVSTPTPEGTPSAEPTSGTSSTTVDQPGNGNGNSNQPGVGNGNGNNGNNGNSNGNGNDKDKNKDPNKKDKDKGPKK